jgi:UDP-N-acetylmuramoyl-L-alanyl-D-glutamate--2,6-diaminopimelate ligase
VTDAAGGGFDIEARSVNLEPGSIVFDLYQSGEFVRSCRLSIVGNFQVENILCMLGMVLGGLNQGRSVPLTLKDILGDKTTPDLLSELTSARGRMELAGEIQDGHNKGAAIYVDYAHTPDALSRSLQALRLHLVNAGGQLHVVFGCGGNRDALKRHQMGQIAHELADRVIITDDNPRDEDPEFIRAQILAGCPDAVGIPDRYKAIQTAIESLRRGDILLVAGKGHETGQIIRGKILPFDDAAVVAELLTGAKV